MSLSDRTVAVSASDPPLFRPPYFLGVDVGGTGIKLGLVDDQGRVLQSGSIETREAEGPVAAMRRVAGALERFESELGIDRQDLAAIGLGAPGPMEIRTGMLVAPPQLPSWSDFNLRDCLAGLIGKPVAFINDANAAAFGEYWLGGGEASDSMVLLTLGTGVGGGIVIEGQMVHGKNSFGGEFGHLVVDPAHDARLCVWGGGRGQLEAYASASAVARRAQERLEAGGGGWLRQINGEITALDVHHAALADDPLALEIIDEAAKWLGVGVTTIVHVLDPGLVVIGGAMTFGGQDCRIGQRFLEGISREFRQRTFDNVFSGTRIGFALLGSDAGYLGAAGYARDHLAAGGLG